jgi:hypothetical protein
MAIVTIVCPDADKSLRTAINKHAREHNKVSINPDQKFAIIILKLGASVTQGDYPALNAQIEAIDGIQDLDLLIDGKVPTTLPQDTSAYIHVRTHIEICDDPEA